MNSFQKYFTFIFLLVISAGFSQEHKTDSIHKIPVSIYTSVQISNDLNSMLNVNERLCLKSYQFLYLNERSIEAGDFTIPFYKISNSPSTYIYDSYNKINQKLVLESAFFKVSDLYKPRAKNPL
ncbi:hypothetical protein ACFQ5N_12535 [Lutibacter holmesii]|uniref:Uncharacterized protein n=1 Tax=Lutibacter holmesii TaxID=1137985 RepID=A0ABW3WQR3_9FLAO